MPEWLQVAAGASEVSWATVVLRMVLASVFGLIVAGLFAVTQRRPGGHTMPLITTLVLLTMLVAMTTIVIGDSVARAFGLVGALSIVRFRTVVDDTRDTSFVIFAVVVGMALGAGNLRICLVGVPAVSLVVFGLSLYGNSLMGISERRLEVRVAAGCNPEQILTGVLDQQLHRWRLVSVGSARQGAAIDLIYRAKLRDPTAMLSLIQAINSIEGVQSVELKED